MGIRTPVTWTSSDSWARSDRRCSDRRCRGSWASGNPRVSSDRPRVAVTLLVAVLAAVVLGLPLLAPRATASPPLREYPEIHAWGLAVDAEGNAFVADGREEPGHVWKIDGAAFSARESDPEAEVETFVHDLVTAPGVRDLQLRDRDLFVSVGAYVPIVNAAGDSVEIPMYGLVRFDLSSLDRADQATMPLVVEATVEPNLEAGVRGEGGEFLIAWTPADSLFEGPCFRVDEEGGVYFGWDGRLRYRDPDGNVSTVLGSSFRGLSDGGVRTARFNEIRSMTFSKDGDFFLLDGARVREIFPKEPRSDAFARALIKRGVLTDERDEDNAKFANRVYGLAASSDGDRVWAAYYGGKKLLVSNRSGRTGTYYEPKDSGWAPVGVAWTEDAIYVLEIYGRITRELRVVRLGRGGDVLVPLPMSR